MKMKVLLSSVFVILLSLGFNNTSSAQCGPRGYGRGFISGGPRVTLSIGAPVVYGGYYGGNYGYRGGYAYGGRGYCAPRYRNYGYAPRGYYRGGRGCYNGGGRRYAYRDNYYGRGYGRGYRGNCGNGYNRGYGRY